MKRLISVVLFLVFSVSLWAQEEVTPSWSNVTPPFPAKGHFIEAVIDTGLPDCGFGLQSQQVQRVDQDFLVTFAAESKALSTAMT
ncbi:MAG: hypothetical protein AAGJ52_01810 [Pseudomonadota bacterium]